MGGYPGVASNCEECDLHRRMFLRRLPIYAAVAVALFIGYKAIRSQV